MVPLFVMFANVLPQFEAFAKEIAMLARGVGAWVMGVRHGGNFTRAGRIPRKKPPPFLVPAAD